MPLFKANTDRQGRGALLSLDLGTHCGWSICDEAGKITSGEWLFVANQNKHPGYRYLKFRYQLQSFRKAQGDKPVKVVYEDINFIGKGNGAHSVQMFGAWRGILLGWCATYDIPVDCVEPKVIKKFIAGTGDAGKPQVIDAVRMAGHDVSDKHDNEADAIALLYLMLEKEKYQ